MEALTVGQVHYGELAHGQGLLEQTTQGNSLNSINSSPNPCQTSASSQAFAGSAIILVEGSTDSLIALASAEEHRRAREPLGLWCPHSAGGTELLPWAGLGCLH